MPGNEACDDRHGQSISLRRLTTGWVSRQHLEWIRNRETRWWTCFVRRGLLFFFFWEQFSKKKKKNCVESRVKNSLARWSFVNNETRFKIEALRRVELWENEVGKPQCISTPARAHIWVAINGFARGGCLSVDKSFHLVSLSRCLSSLLPSSSSLASFFLFVPPTRLFPAHSHFAFPPPPLPPYLHRFENSRTRNSEQTCPVGYTRISTRDRARRRECRCVNRLGLNFSANDHHGQIWYPLSIMR